MTGELGRQYALPRTVTLRESEHEVLAWVDGAREAVELAAAAPESLAVAPRSGRGVLRRVDSPLGPLFVREYRKGGMLRGVRGRWFRGRLRPLDELALVRRLLAVHVPVVEAVGAVVLRSRAGWRGSLLTKEVRGALDLETFLYDPAAHSEWPLSDVLVAAGRAVRALHDAGVRHGDLHLKNIVLDPETAGARVLDFDRSVATDAPLSDGERLSDLVRLARSVEKHRLRGLAVGRRAALRFLRAYGGDAAAGDRWLDAIRGRLVRGLAARTLWWRVTGQARPRAAAAAVRAEEDGDARPRASA